MTAAGGERGALDLPLAIARARPGARSPTRVAPPEPLSAGALTRLAVLGSGGPATVLLAAALEALLAASPGVARGVVAAAGPASPSAAATLSPPVSPPSPSPGRARTGSVQAPVQVPALPYRARGDTRGAAGAMARYACAPGVDEGGGEVWYAVAVRGRGRLRAAITEDPSDGVDVDVHLLSRPDPDGCVARGDAAAEAEVEPGAWFVVVDTCASSGRPLPGPFALELTFDRDPGRAPR